VKIALTTAPFSWFRGGPARAMGHFGEKGSQRCRFTTDLRMIIWSADWGVAPPLR
jgi:hypothetical protein